MDLQGEIVAACATGITLVLSAFAWWIKHVGGRSDRRLEEARKEHRTAIEASEKRCREENADVNDRIRELEDARHRESREDQRHLTEIIAQHGEDHRAAANITAGGNRALATAIEKLAERMPDHTPSKGSKTT